MQKYPWRSDTFQPVTLLKVTLLHGFSRFLNCSNGTQLRKASHLKFHRPPTIINVFFQEIQTQISFHSFIICLCCIQMDLHHMLG